MPKPVSAKPELMYPYYETRHYCDESSGILAPGSKYWGSLTAEKAKVFLGWEAEEDYANRQRAANPGIEGVIEYGKDFMFLDAYGRKIRCSALEKNRLPDKHTWESYTQSVLTRNWAGPTTMSGETPNGETMIISRSGMVLSAMHRLIALVIAHQTWEKDDYWHTLWPTPPVMDTDITLGVSDDPRVIQTLDNVRTRTLDDTIYTSPVFADLNRDNKQLCSRILAGAVKKVLWKRTWYGSKENTRTKYLTTAQSMNFIKAHPKLQECVRHIWQEDKDRHIAKAIDTRYAAAAMYLMLTSSTSEGAYGSDADGELPDEKLCDLSMKKKAEQFWVDFVHENKLLAVHLAINALNNPATGAKAPDDQKLAVIAKAWGIYYDKGASAVQQDNLDISDCFQTKPDGTIVFCQNIPTFGGIDLGVPDKTIEKEATPAQVKETKKQIRERIARETLESKAAQGIVTLPIPKGGGEAREQLEDLRQRFDKCLIAYVDDKNVIFHGTDALTLSNFGLIVKAGPVEKHKVTIPTRDWEALAYRLTSQGYGIAAARAIDDETLEVSRYYPPTPEESVVETNGQMNGEESVSEETVVETPPPAKKVARKTVSRK